eukprot:TRINITY_DN1871_c2_g1_i3.p1 TRINITY_DN1871_c2_g1~~TRINITY_DN1871_c2_g1_i3.p1  ORF type:complete len:678 (-),score=56.14 TRINITY_DN1871_c2_g1_i3:341-2236(-)
MLVVLECFQNNKNRNERNMVALANVELLEQFFQTLELVCSLATELLIKFPLEQISAQSPISSGDFYAAKSVTRRLFTPGSSPAPGEGDSPEREEYVVRRGSAEAVSYKVMSKEMQTVIMRVLQMSKRFVELMVKLFGEEQESVEEVRKVVECLLELMMGALKQLGGQRSIGQQKDQTAVMQECVSFFIKLATEENVKQYQALALMNLNLLLTAMKPYAGLLQKVVDQLDFHRLLEFANLQITQPQILSILLVPLLTISQSEEGARILYQMGIGHRILLLSRQIVPYYTSSQLPNTSAGSTTPISAFYYTQESPPVRNPLFQVWLLSLKITTSLMVNLFTDASVSLNIIDETISFFSFHSDFLHDAIQCVIPQDHSCVELNLLQLQNAESSFQFFYSLLSCRGEWLAMAPQSPALVLRAATRFVVFFADFVRQWYSTVEYKARSVDEQLMARSPSKLRVQQGLVLEIIEKSQQDGSKQSQSYLEIGRRQRSSGSPAVASSKNLRVEQSQGQKQGNAFVDAAIQTLYGCLQVVLMFLCRTAEAVQADHVTLQSSDWPRRDDLLMVQQECVIVTQDWSDQEGIFQNSQVRLLAQKMMQVLTCCRWLYGLGGHSTSEEFLQEVNVCVAFLDRLAA